MISEKPSVVAQKNGIRLPAEYAAAMRDETLDLGPWHFVSDSEFDGLFTVMNKHYPMRTVIPFARRRDNDDVASFVVRDPEQAAGQIILIQDFEAPGYEVFGRLASFGDWLEQLKEDVAEWNAADSS
jgi:hypothetical protein